MGWDEIGLDWIDWDGVGWDGMGWDQRGLLGGGGGRGRWISLCVEVVHWGRVITGIDIGIGTGIPTVLVTLTTPKALATLLTPVTLRAPATFS